MASIIDTLSEREIRDLISYAEDTLPEGRRAEVEAWVASSPELEELVRRQRLSLAATRGLADEAAPASLTAAVGAGHAGAPRPRRRLALVLSAAGLLVVVLIAVVAFSVGTTPAGPTVADAARLATLPATEAPPSPVPGTGRLDATVGALAFPDLSGHDGWRAVGARRDTLSGRDVTVVYYADEGEQVGYAIVDSPVLARPVDAAATVRDGVEYLSLVAAGYPVVTWQRDGHTCVLVGDAPPERLLELARWSDGAGAGY